MTYRRVLSISFGVLVATVLVACGNGQTADQSAASANGAASSSQVSINITQPAYGFNVLPGSVRRIFATVMNGKTNGVLVSDWRRQAFIEYRELGGCDGAEQRQ